MTISFRVSAAADFSWRARMPRDLRALRSQERLRLRLERLVDDGGFSMMAVMTLAALGSGQRENPQSFFGPSAQGASEAAKHSEFPAKLHYSYRR